MANPTFEGSFEKERAPVSSADEVAKIQESYKRRMRFYRLCWLLWIAGTILIVLSWTHTVSYEIGWVGFGVAGTGTLLSMLTYGPYGRRDRFA
jgi:hypothetical protein